MRIAIPKETTAGERRVALVPESCVKADAPSRLGGADLVLKVTPPVLDHPHREQ